MVRPRDGRDALGLRVDRRLAVGVLDRDGEGAVGARTPPSGGAVGMPALAQPARTRAATAAAASAATAVRVRGTEFLRDRLVR